MSHDDYTIGIEEEYFLVNAGSCSLASFTCDSLFEDADAATAGSVKREFLQSQIEAVTRPHSSIAAARHELVGMRLEIAEIAASLGLAVMASGTHPSARWSNANASPGWRYEAVMDSLQMIGRRNMLCGTHVHVELPDPDRRFDVMTRMIPYLPLLHALSTSSPFWQGHRTGLKGYRLAAYDELPRTGLPELLRTRAEFDRYVDALVEAGAIADSSHIWWALRPSLNYPTLELRALDCCTRVEDTIAIAALYRAIARHLFLNPARNASIGCVDRAIAKENQWLAKRHGTSAKFVTSNGATDVDAMLDDVIDLVAADAEALGCLAEIMQCRTIAREGSSADTQLSVYENSADVNPSTALEHVARWLVHASTASARALSGSDDGRVAGESGVFPAQRAADAAPLR